MERSCVSTPSCKCFTIGEASTCVSEDGRTLKIIASVACRGTDVEKMRMSGFGSRQTKFLTWDHKNMSLQANSLVRVGIGRSDCRYETESPFDAIPQFLGLSIFRRWWFWA